MKRVVSILLALCLALSFQFTAYAVAPAPVKIEINGASSAQGSTVTVAVYMDPGDYDFWFYSMSVEYNPDVFEPVQNSDVRELAEYGGGLMLDASMNGMITVSGATLTVEKEAVFSVDFRIKSSAPTGDSPITIADGSATYTSDDDLPVTILSENITSGLVTVTVAADTTAPTVTAATYSDALAVDADLELTFSEPVTAVTGKNIVIHKLADDSDAMTIAANDTAQVTIAGANVTIKPAGSLEAGTSYYGRIDAGAFQDAAGIPYAGISDSTTWRFATAATPLLDTAVIEIGSASGEAGTTVTIPVKLISTSASGVASYGIQIEYDATALEVSSVTGEAGDYFSSVIDNTNGRLKAAWADATGGDHLIAAGSTMFTIAFKVKTGAPAGNKPLTVSSQNDLQHFTITDAKPVELQKSLTAGKVTVTIPQPQDNGGNMPSAPSQAPVNTSVDVLINDKIESAGTGATTTVNGQSVTTVTIDPKKLEDRLSKEGERAVITIPLKMKSDIVIVELNGQMIKSLEQKQAVLVIQTDNATYTLPALQININAISAQLGKTVALQDIAVRIEIATPTAEMVKVVEDSAVDGGFTLVVPPLNFTVKGVYGDSTIEVSTFNAYVERTIAMPDGVDPSRITTGVVIDPDGTVRHVPTQIIQIDGKYYAKLNSLTNSTYAVVWHPLEFADVAGHWAQDAVNDMGSRMIVNGVEDNLFHPDLQITRAEFAAIMVRGLGLKPPVDSSPFPDVNESDWYAVVVQTAYTYGLIGGFEDGTFRPTEQITREQAMTIIAKAMALTELKSKQKSIMADLAQGAYADESDVSAWAVPGVNDSLQAGIVSGRNGGKLAPKANMTRAEAASMIQRLLQKSKLI